MTKETSEKKAIKEYLKIRNVFFYHNLAGLGVFPGVPDITAIKDGIVYQIEVKIKGGRQSENQKEFQRRWTKNGGRYILGGLDEVIKVFY